MMLWRGPPVCSPTVLERRQQSRASQSDAAMLMDVGHRLMCSLRQVDSRCRSCHSPRAFLLTTQFNIRRLDVGISSRYCWHGSRRVVSDDKLVNLLRAIVRFGEALRSWRSWVLGSERLADRCSLHRFVVVASTEAGDIQDVIKNDQLTLAQTNEDKRSLLEAQKCGEKSSLGKSSKQKDDFEFPLSHEIDDLVKDSSIPKTDVDVTPNGLDGMPSSELEFLTKVVVIIFDIETTGFKLSDDRIVEFAARDLTGGDCSTIQTLVNPERPIPLHATNVHGIHSDMVNKSDIPRWKEVAPILIQFVESRRIAGGPVFLVAHNGKRFDVPFLMYEFERCSLQIPSWWQFVDSVPIAREAMKAKGGKGLPLRLSALYEYYKLPYIGQAHRALADVHMLACVLQMLMKDLKMPVSDFLKRSFTIKDILRSSARSSDNLESLSQNFEMSNECLMEAEDLTEVSCAPCEADEDSCIPWDDDQSEQPIEKSLMLEVMDSHEGSPDGSANEVETRIKTQTSTNIKRNEVFTSKETEPAAKPISISGGIFSNLGPAYNSKLSYCTVEPDNIDLGQLTSTLKQYMEMKSERPELLLLWKVGDFYQAFFEDAKKLSEVCNVALAAIKGGEFLDGLVPMASLHCSHVDIYIGALLAEGVSVFKKDQVGRVAHGTQAQVHVSTILTPGTARIDRRLEASSSRYLLAIVPPHTEDGTWGLAYADVATGEICATEGQGQSSMIEEIFALHPSEIIFSANAISESSHLPLGLPPGFCYSARPPSEFCPTSSREKLQDIFGVNSLEHSGLGTLPIAVCAAGGLLRFLEDIQCSSGVELSFHKISPYFLHDYLLLDQYTRSCLEVFKTKRQGQSEGSLLWAMDHTKTAMGKRLLRKWLLRPLLDKELICARLNAVEVFVNDSELLEQVRHDLSLMNDLERLAEDIVSDLSSPWDLLAMGQSVNILGTLCSKLEGHLNPYFVALACDKTLLDMGQKFQNYFEVEASSIMQDGQIIKNNVDEGLDALRSEIHSLDFSIKNFEQLERDRTKISSLEIVKNEKGDHFIRVKKYAFTNISFPADYQLYTSETSEDADCFVTTSLLELNKKRLEMITKIRLREAEILKSLKGEMCSNLRPLQMASQAIAAIDALATFAEVSVLRDYCKPVIIEDSREITVMGGRHPVAELLKPERKCFNANSLYMGYQSKLGQKSQHKSTLYSGLNELSGFLPEECWPRPDVLILTGPPASGKSCYLRQAGHIQILAQIGSYVPAEEAIVGIADAIFMKMDDCDDVSTSQSSFELDMNRCVNILRNATSQSLVLLDGVARVTSSHDDGALTRAIVEFLAQNVKARTLLTTQNSNLGSLEEEFSNVSSFQCMNNVDSMFSYSVKPGFSFESHVVTLDKIEGFPKWISSRAAQLISKDEITGDEALQLEQHLCGNGIIGEESLQLEQYSPDSDTTGEQHDQLEQHLPEGDAIAGEVLPLEQHLPSDATREEDFYQLEQQSMEGSSSSKSLLSGMKPEILDMISNHTNEMDPTVSNPTSSSEGVIEMVVESSENLQSQESADLKTLKDTWLDVLQVLQDYPATHALAKQKGTLVAIKKSLDVSQVHMSTSDLFLKKFLQHEHATALENAFLTVLQSPIQLKLTNAADRKL
eukprot:c17863_g1_i1 orf=49-4944(+)